MKDAGHPHRNRGLAGAGIAREAHVKGRRCRERAEPFARAFNKEKGRDLANAGLDRLEAHKLPVKLVENGGNARFLIFAAQIDTLLRKSLRFFHHANHNTLIQCAAR